MKKDITPYGWLLVGALCVISGIRHMIIQEIYGKVRTVGAPPLMEGGPVLVTGLLELLLGLFIAYMVLRKKRD